MTIKRTQLAAMMAAAISLPVATQALADQHRIYFNPFVGYQHFDDQRDLDNSPVYGAGLELRMLPRWAVEAVFSYSEPDQKYTSGNATFREIRIDGLHYFGTPADRLNPYVAVGFGHADFDNGPELNTKGSYHDEAQINVGGGVRYNINDLFALRADLRGFHGLDESTFDARATIGFSLALNKGSDPTPAPAPVAVVEADEDNDGVPDSRDQCPGTPAGAAVDQYGCELDSDGDGVVDRLDRCPNTAAGVKVDETGCEVVTLETINLYVTFPIDSAQIGSEFDAEIRQVAEAMRDDEEVTVEIAGHSDSTGRAEYNLDLSQRRAESVADRLVNVYGIDSSRVTAVGYGEAEPLASNDTAEGRAQNRRVEARIQVRR